MIKRFLAAAAVAFGLAQPVSAHPAPFSYLDVVFRNGNIEGSLVVHVIDVAQELGMKPEQLMNSDVVRQHQQRIGDVLQRRIVLTSDRRLSLAWTGIDMLRDDQALKLT
jgi:hypothetical protein